MKKSLLEILKFEIIFKLIILFAVAPLLNLAYRFYYAKVGVVFNTKIFTSLLSVNGILFLIILLSILFVSNYFEIAVILLTINKNIRGLDYSLTDVVDKLSFRQRVCSNDATGKRPFISFFLFRSFIQDISFHCLRGLRFRRLFLNIYVNLCGETV